MNKIRKMNRTTQKGMAWLRKQGFIVDYVPHTRWKKDLFGVADAVAIKDAEVYFVQFKTNQFGSDNLYQQFFEKYKVNIIVLMFKDREKLPYVRIWDRLSPHRQDGYDYER